MAEGRSARPIWSVAVKTHTEVGDEGIDEGDFEPMRCVRRCCDVLFDSLFSLGVAVRFEFEETWWTSRVGAAVGTTKWTRVYHQRPLLRADRAKHLRDDVSWLICVISCCWRVRYERRSGGGDEQ